MTYTEVEKTTITVMIVEYLAMIFPDEVYPGKWLYKENTNHIFDGKRPIDLMLTDSKGLKLVYEYVKNKAING